MRLRRIKLCFLALSLCSLPTGPTPATPLGTAITYQGRLSQAGAPANGSYDVRLTLWDAVTNGSPVGQSVTNTALAISNGSFTATLDFGAGGFDGNARWLEISVRTNGDPVFTALSPRQPLTPSPQALYAPNAGTAATANSVPAANILGTLAFVQLPGALITNNQSGVTLNGAFAGNGSGLTNLDPTAASLAVGPVVTNAGTASLRWVDAGNNPQHLNKGYLKKIYARLYKKLPLRVLYLGDSVGLDPAPALNGALAQCMPHNGSLTGMDGDTYYLRNNSDENVWRGSGDADWFGPHFDMSGNGNYLFFGSLRGLSSVYANMLTVGCLRGNGYGVLTIQTQTVAGAWGTVATIDCGTGPSPWITNIVLPNGNYLAKAITSGTNTLFALGLWSTNAGAGFTASDLTTSGVDPIAGMMQAQGSNAVHRFFAGLDADLLILNYKRWGVVSNDIPWLLGVLSNACPLMDVVLCNSQESYGTTDQEKQRQAMREVALQFKVPLFDAWSYGWPSASMYALGYLRDSVHLTRDLSLASGPGAPAVFHDLPEWLGLDVASLLQWGYPLLSDSGGGQTFLSRSSAPTVQMLGGNGGALWVNNGALYFTFTTDGVNTTTVKVAGP